MSAWLKIRGTVWRHRSDISLGLGFVRIDIAHAIDVDIDIDIDIDIDNVMDSYVLPTS